MEPGKICDSPRDYIEEKGIFSFGCAD